MTTSNDNMFSSDSESWLSEMGDNSTSGRLSSSSSISLGLFTCSRCNKKFHLERELRKHRKAHLTDNQKPYPCPICGKAFLYPKDRTRHKASVHDDAKEKERASSSARFCPVSDCPRQEHGFSRSADLVRHLRTVHAKPEQQGIVAYRCTSDNCPTPQKRWYRLDNLHLHIRRVHGDEKEHALIEKSKRNALDMYTQEFECENISTFNAKQWEPSK
ncbi:hypothetical protein BGW36DRAFT_43887 [Talaromyces proteolyticus]|uniref:C2H2-type domain-containing protein n=1 Tax=Talaromyces proteolyticus TaxID=1131652 RepID=A0AAD4KHG2_9EURO|nr:uncharacterized protein BGW36DRAFT_43887 [Talaromyces proteolyticus]KAH8692239.1 hypothetical protein BGW36DRAFT_43887 [Talaromyces proteolyticus]